MARLTAWIPSVLPKRTEVLVGGFSDEVPTVHRRRALDSLGWVNLNSLGRETATSSVLTSRILLYQKMCQFPGQSC